MPEPVIPEFITVHLGPPSASAENVTVTFSDYIKNVASSEIYPTWPEAALRANIYAQISYALNRVFTEYYRGRGYDFDITNSTSVDQSFVKGRDIFENISQIVDDIFNDYLRRPGFIEPLFAQYCDGVETTCNGLSQWGSVDLANQGYGPFDILQYYYGNDLELVRDAPISENVASYPGTPLRLGDQGDNVTTIQRRLNRVSKNYPAIPKVYPVNGIFDIGTENAVKEFQRVFDLTPDGIVGKATWYRLTFIYNNVKRLSELDSEGLTLSDVERQYPGDLEAGDTGLPVEALQYYLATIGNFDNSVPIIAVDSIFGPATQNAVIAVQRKNGLPLTGIVDRATWDAIKDEYLGIINTIPVTGDEAPRPYPGRLIVQGSRGENVLLIQQYLDAIAQSYTSLPRITADGVFGAGTRRAVAAFQQLFGIPATGAVGPNTWYAIQDLYFDLQTSGARSPGQFGGSTLAEGSRDS